jgi:hypothetical protein
MKIMTLENDSTQCEPHLQLNHIDGPLLIRPDGCIHWLTFRERIALFFGFLDAASLEAKLTSK